MKMLRWRDINIDVTSLCKHILFCYRNHEVCWKIQIVSEVFEAGLLLVRNSAIVMLWNMYPQEKEEWKRGLKVLLDLILSLFIQTNLPNSVTKWTKKIYLDNSFGC